VSLSWAVFDLVAANFSIPWDVSRHGRSRSIDGGDTYHQRSTLEESEREDASKLTHVMSLAADTLSLGSDDSQLAVLSEVVSDHESEIGDYLESLLEYQYCEDCERRYAADDDRTTCEREDCDGRIRHAGEQFGDLVEDAISNFDDRYITHYQEYQESLESERASLSERDRELRRDQQRASADERGRASCVSAAGSKNAWKCSKSISDLGEVSYFDFLRESRESKYDFSMRSVATTAGLTLVDEGYDRRNVGDQSSGRAMRMALSELHPGAAYLDNG